MSADYSSWDLKTLKQAIETSDISWLQTSAQQFEQGSQACSQAADDFMAQVSSLGAAWEGAAASAATSDAQKTRQSMTQMHSASTASSSSSKQYYQETKANQERSKSIPNVDDSWGHAIATGAPGGIIGIGAAKMVQKHKYDKAHTQAVQIANKMDSGGTQQANAMRAQSWPTGPTSGGNPPSSLPPVPGSSGRAGNINGNYNASPHGGGPGGGYSPIVGGSTSSPGTSQIINQGVQGNGPTKPPPGDVFTGPTQPTSIPQNSNPGTGGTDASTFTEGATPTEALPPVPTVGGGGPGTSSAAPAAGLLGGAGLLGAGALGATGSLAGGGRLGAASGEPLAEGEGSLRGRSGSLAEGERAGIRSGSGLAEGERAGIRSGSGLAEGEGSLRPGARSGAGGLGEEELGSRGRGYLRGGAPEGFMGEPVAGEAGRLGGYPGGGGGSRRRDDDEEAPVPDYLVETEDVWGDGVTAAPPVIGE